MRVLPVPGNTRSLIGSIPYRRTALRDSDLEPVPFVHPQQLYTCGQVDIERIVKLPANLDALSGFGERRGCGKRATTLPPKILGYILLGHNNVKRGACFEGYTKS